MEVRETRVELRRFNSCVRFTFFSRQIAVFNRGSWVRDDSLQNNRVRLYWRSVLDLGDSLEIKHDRTAYSRLLLDRKWSP